jgi:DNA invertase Pin-like site-specific DNA recombinase
MPKASSRLAFSYIRFSHPKQAQGGGLDRQVRLSQGWCKRRGVKLDDSLNLQDLGVSAFRGHNVRDGALAGFLEACRIGRVPRGAYLIVESLDRLSRDEIRPALQLFLALQDFGVTIVTLQPEREYPPDATDALALIEPLIIFARAHEESAMKSHRRKEGWRQARDRARQGGGPMLKTCPAWLEVTEDGFQVKEEAAAVVRRIYAMARDGLGVHRITERLAEEKVPPIGTGGRWVKAYVYKLLVSPAAMGTYQPQREEGKKSVNDGDPIPGYYPAVVKEDDWNATQAAIQRRTGGRGAGRKGGEETNLFTGLLYSATTREKMQLTHAMGRKVEGERKRYRYLASTMETGTPKPGPRVDYAVFEAAVLSKLRELKPADVAPDEAHANGRESEIARLSGRLLDIDSRLERTRQRAKTAGDFDTYLDLIEELQGERKQVSERLKELQEESESGQSSANLGEAQSLIEMLERVPESQREDLRRRLKGRIRQLVSEVWVLTVPRGRDRLIAVQVFFRSERRREYIIVNRPGKMSGPIRVEGQSRVCSFAEVMDPGDLDLRNDSDVGKLARLLGEIDAAALWEAMRDRPDFTAPRRGE